jgi:hypothetical protein
LVLYCGFFSTWLSGYELRLTFLTSSLLLSLKNVSLLSLPLLMRTGVTGDRNGAAFFLLCAFMAP